jgi:galactokinase
MNNIVNNLHNNFRNLYNKEPEIYFSPGRVNLIGEHTDYNNGFVMPFAIDLGTYIAVSKRDDGLVHVYSENLDEKKSFALSEIKIEISNTWINYVKGVLNTISIDYSKTIAGADIYIFSDLPFGAGLSSSASLTTVLAFAYNELYRLGLSKFELSKIAQSVEHSYIGTKCGLMDQMACILSQKNMATMIDCDSYEYKKIPFNLDEICLLICDTNIKHNLAESAYNDRRKGCENIANFYELQSLRGLNKDLLTDTEAQFDVDTYKLAKHIYKENYRVQKAAKAMNSKNWGKLGKLMYKSHYSLKNNYKVSCAELDYLVELSESYDGVFGARMTGGGFGGSTIHLIPNDILEEYKNYLEKEYYNRFKIKPLLYVSKACDGAKKL